MGWANVAFIVAGTLASLTALAGAVFLLVALPPRRVNRLLAAIVLTDFVFMAGFVATFAMGFFAEEPAWYAAIEPWVNLVAATALGVLPCLVLLLVSYVIDSPLVRPLRNPPARLALLVLPVVWVAYWVFLRITNTASPVDFGAVLMLVALASLYALVAAATAVQLAPPNSIAHRHARSFILAFGIRDGLWLGILVTFNLLDALSIGDSLSILLWLPVATLAFVPFLIVGIVRHQLFDIDVVLHRTVRRGILGFVLLGGCFAAAGLTEQWLQKYNWVAGGLAVGFLLLLTHPLQRFAERLANFTIPNAKPLDRLAAGDREDLYREQLRVAWEDGALSPKERRLLEVARERLGISVETAHRLELEQTAAPAVSMRPPRTRARPQPSGGRR